MYRILSLLVYAFGLAAFSGLLVLWIRQRSLGRPGIPGWLYPAVFACCAAWFALNLATSEYFVLLSAGCVFPPLLGRLYAAGPIWPLSALSAVVAALPWVHPVRRDAALAYCLLIAAAAVPGLVRRRASIAPRWMLAAALAVVPVALLTAADWPGLLMRSLPLSLLMADSYVRRRFLFLDLFVKWGTYFAISLAALTAWLRFVPQPEHPVQRGLLMLPLLWGVPRLCRWLGEFLDRRLLGRPYPAAQAQRLFLERLQGVAGETALLDEARTVLGDIFQTAATIGPDGQIELAPRPDGRPMFSEDRQLVRTLTRTLTFLIDNRRLDARRRDLQLEASRSQLKALRAQISPHFLFNALNTVAGLIPTNPVLAEATVERLADVFRYTLKRSETELTPLAEELDFLRAWLDVQQARFAERLVVQIDADPLTLSVRIPALALQTLVENAIKHGVARATTPCRVSIRARVTDGLLRIEVADSGPGPLDPTPSSGHGLTNIRQRLDGYYEGRAVLRLNRDETAGLTTATLEIPV